MAVKLTDEEMMTVCEAVIRAAVRQAVREVAGIVGVANLDIIDYAYAPAAGTITLTFTKPYKEPNAAGQER